MVKKVRKKISFPDEFNGVLYSSSLLEQYVSGDKEIAHLYGGSLGNRVEFGNGINLKLLGRLDHPEITINIHKPSDKTRKKIVQEYLQLISPRVVIHKSELHKLVIREDRAVLEFLKDGASLAQPHPFDDVGVKYALFKNRREFERYRKKWSSIRDTLDFYDISSTTREMTLEDDILGGPASEETKKTPVDHCMTFHMCVKGEEIDNLSDYVTGTLLDVLRKPDSNLSLLAHPPVYDRKGESTRTRDYLSNFYNLTLTVDKKGGITFQTTGLRSADETMKANIVEFVSGVIGEPKKQPHLFYHEYVETPMRDAVKGGLSRINESIKMASRNIGKKIDKFSGNHPTISRHLLGENGMVNVCGGVLGCASYIDSYDPNLGLLGFVIRASLGIGIVRGGWEGALYISRWFDERSGESKIEKRLRDEHVREYMGRMATKSVEEATPEGTCVVATTWECAGKAFDKEKELKMSSA